MKVYIYILLILATLLFCCLSDYTIGIASHGNKEYWAIFDTFAHGVIAFLIILPCAWRNRRGNFKLLILAALSAMALDLDHFVASRSVSLTEAVAITSRPPTHSLTFAALMSIGAYIFTKRLQPAWALFAAMASHSIRDAAFDSERIFYPFQSRFLIPYYLYLLIIMAFQQISWGAYTVKDRN